MSTSVWQRVLARVRHVSAKLFLIDRSALSSDVVPHVDLAVGLTLTTIGVAILQWLVVFFNAGVVIEHYAEGVSLGQKMDASDLNSHFVFYMMYALMLSIILAAFAVVVGVSFQAGVALYLRETSGLPPLACTIVTLFFAMVQTTITGCEIAEMSLLNDMAVHFIDFDLSSLNFFETIRRRHNMGANLKPALNLLIRVGAVLLIIALFNLAAYCTRLAQRKKGLQLGLKKVGIAGIVYTVLMLFAINNPDMFLSSGVPQFQEQIPFNFFHIRNEPLKGSIKVSTDYPPNGKAYPILEELGDYPMIINKKNIVIIAQESYRADEFTPEKSPWTHAFFQQHTHITSGKHLSAGHVSELAHFSIKYGLHGYLYNHFMYKWVPSFLFDLLRHNSYKTICLYATRVWSFPNGNLFEICDDLYIDDDWTPMIEDNLVSFIDARAQDGQPFFLYISPHKQGRGHNEEKDQQRKLIIEKLIEHKLLDKTVLLVTGDHGDMHGEHMEQGHGQQESNWWNEKIEVPFHLLLPHGDSAKYKSKLGLTSHVDIIPTLVEFLNIEPRIPAHYYSNGMSLLVPHNAPDPTLSRYAVITARYFPLREKTNAFVQLDKGKFWFRVLGASSTGRLDVLPIYESDLHDEQTCPQERLRELFPEALKKAWRRVEEEGSEWKTPGFNYQVNPDQISTDSEGRSACNVDTWAAMLVDYNIKMNTFFTQDPPLQ